MYKPSHKNHPKTAFENIINSSSHSNFPLKLRSTSNTSNFLPNKPVQIQSPNQDSKHALNFYLDLPKDDNSMSKTTRNSQVKEKYGHSDENLLTEPAQYTSENIESYKPPPKSASRFSKLSNSSPSKFRKIIELQNECAWSGVESIGKKNLNHHYESSVNTTVSPKTSLPFNHKSPTSKDLLSKISEASKGLSKLNSFSNSMMTKAKIENFLSAKDKHIMDNSPQETKAWSSKGYEMYSPKNQSTVVIHEDQLRRSFPWEAEGELRTEEGIDNMVVLTPKGVNSKQREAIKMGFQPAENAFKFEYSRLAECRSDGHHRNEKSILHGERISSPRNMISGKNNLRNSITDKNEETLYNEGYRGSTDLKGVLNYMLSPEEKFFRDRSQGSKGSAKKSEKNKLLEMIAQLNKELEDKDEEIVDLQNKKTKGELENNRLGCEIEGKEELRRRSEETLRNLKEKAAEQDKEIKTLKRSKGQLERSLREFGVKGKDYKESVMKMTKYREEVEAADKEIVRLKEKILLSSVEESKAIETENALSNQEKLRLEEDARMKEEEIKKLEKDFRDLQEKQKEYEFIDAKIEELEDLQYELEGENDRLKEISLYFNEAKHNSYSQNRSLLSTQSLFEIEDTGENLLRIRKKLREIESYSVKVLEILEATVQKKDIPIELILPHNRYTKAQKKQIKEDEGIEDGLTDEGLKEVFAQCLKSIGTTRRLFEKSFVNITNESWI